MDQATAVVIGASVGAIAAICGQWIQAWRQSRIEAAKLTLERAKLNHSQAASLHSEMREALQNAIQKLASATHSMCWLTWIAKESPKRFGETQLQRYDKEMHILLPEIIGLQARISSYVPELGIKLLELTARIEDLDERIARTAISVIDGVSQPVESLSPLHREAIVLHEQLAHLCHETSMKNYVPEA
ncbi:hypothetical protein [Zoogloea sp.]|uniref:hypothetical protein n=1 Tax=Zoogloea sp. TaxID=49181 RepID=UPI0035B1A4FA